MTKSGLMIRIRWVKCYRIVACIVGSHTEWCGLVPVRARPCWGSVQVFENAYHAVLIINRRKTQVRNNHISYMSVVGSDLYVNSSTGFNSLDIENGRIKERGYTRGVSPIFFATGDIIYHGRFGEHLVASNKVTNDILWEVKFEKEIVQAPLFVDNIVLVRTDKSGFLGKVFAIDLATGEILWSSPRNIVSNVTAANNVAYYLTEESHLIAVDIITGERVGSVEFSPKITALEPIDQVNEDFYVAAYNEIIVVYFGSGSQLFAFRFLGSGE